VEGATLAPLMIVDYTEIEHSTQLKILSSFESDGNNYQSIGDEHVETGIKIHHKHTCTSLSKILL
jgi:hypothetical protein